MSKAYLFILLCGVVACSSSNGGGDGADASAERVDEKIEETADAGVAPNDATCTEAGSVGDGGLASFQGFRAVHGVAPDRWMAVGDQGLIALFDGTALRRVGSCVDSNLEYVWMTGRDRAWLAGGNRLLHWENGVGVTPVALSENTTVQILEGSAPDNVWIGLQSQGRYGLVRWDGGALITVPPLADASLAIRDLIVLSRTDVWLLAWRNQPSGPWDSTWHWDGSRWTPISPETPDISYFGEITRLGDGTIWAVHQLTQGLSRWQADAWMRIHVAPAFDFGVITFGRRGKHMWGASENDLWTPTHHFGGAAWDSIPADGKTYVSIWGTAANDIVRVGVPTAFSRFDGARWTPIDLAR